MTEENQQEKRGKRPSAKDARARMSRAVSSQTPQARAVEEPGQEGGAPETGGEKLTRLSVDVPRSQHRYLRILAAESEATGMAVVRALIAEAEADPELARRVQQRLSTS